MKTFNEFITELFDTPVKVKKIQTIGSHHHVYMFKVNNVPYHVHIQHLFADKTKADVDFGDRTKSPEESMSTTGSQGSHAPKVFGAVKTALQMHNKENPHIKEYTFDASEEKSGDVNPARTRLYGAMARRAGGKAFGNSFKIPSTALKESEDDKPVRIKLRGGANNSRKSDDFMDEYHGSTQEHPFDSHSRVHGEGATTELSRDGSSSIHMHDIRSLTPGGGSKALEHLKSLADKHGVSITGTAKAYAKSSKYPMNSKQLSGWYKKRGFSVGEGDNIDGYSISYNPKSIKEEVDGGDNPFQKTVKAYKLFRTHPKHPGKLFPLFVNNKEPVEQGKWLKAKAGPPGKNTKKVKSSLGDLAYRPGWHSGDLPIATHIGGKSKAGLKKPDYRPSNHVWAEVEHPADVDWQSIANSRAKKTKAGKVKSETAHITDQVPHGGHYRYKTNPNMTGNWIISGDMKVNRVLSDDEVSSINKKAGVADLPRRPDIEAAKKAKSKKVKPTE